MIEAKILADSCNPSGNRLTTFQCTYPDVIHPEILTHRMFSRNTSSRRAIPIKRFIRGVLENQFNPIHLGKNQSGMQAKDEVDETSQEEALKIWNEAREAAVKAARALDSLGIHKQVANRILQPFSHTTCIISATDFRHFFVLRDDAAAEHHIQELARQMKGALRKSQPEQLIPGDWHLPLVREEDRKECNARDLVKISIGRCARVSYKTHEGLRDTQKDIELFERLRTSGHWSPFEHVATPLPIANRVGNFMGWVQARKLFREEYREENPPTLRT